MPRLLASLSVELPAAGHEIQLMPAGRFRAQDGRPRECGAWQLDAATAAALTNQVAARKTPFVIDYEHQSLAAATSGTPAPAAGWFSRIEWRADLGLFAVGVEWTERAAAMIAAHEYRFISPVFSYDRAGRPTRLINAALTNNPALDGMDEVRLAALSQALGFSSTPSLQETSDMDELKERLRWLLNLPAGVTANEIGAQLDTVIERLSGGQGTAAAAVDLPALLAERDERIAALTATQADPARFIPVETYRALQSEAAALRKQAADREIDELVTAALTDGRLHTAAEAWARSLGTTSIASLRDYLAVAPKVAALTGMQSDGKRPPAQAEHVDETLLAVCRMFGNDPAAVKQHLEG